MEDRGGAWHGHGASSAFKANDDEPSMQGITGKLQDMNGGRDEERADENRDKKKLERAIYMTQA